MSREEAGVYHRLRVGTMLRGSDPEVTREHIRVALALAAVIGVGAALGKVVLVSPIVWEVFYGSSFNLA